MAGVILHGAHFGRGPERVRDPFRRPFVIGREGDAHMAIVENGIVGAIGFLDLVQTLGDEEAFEAIARHEGQGRFEEIETSECRKLVEHQQDAVPAVLCVQFLRQATADLVEDQTNQRFRPADVGGRHNEIQRRRPAVLDEIGDPPIASARHFRDHRIAVET